MTFLHLIAYAGVGLSFIFVTLSLTCGLYYLAELVEEYTVLTRKIITWMTMTIAGLHVLLLLIDRYPFFRTVFSLTCLGVYSLNLKTFPFISLTSPPFLASCVLVLLNHYLWFTYFSSHYEPFMDIASFFGIMVWLVPFAYFISLSANDAVLPTSDVTNPTPVQGHQALLKTILEYLPRIGTKKRDNNGVFPASSSQESFQRPPMGFAPPNETPLYTQEAEVPDYAFQPYQSQKSSQSTPSPAHSMAPPYDPRDQSARNGTAETAYAGKITPGLGNISNSSTTRVHAGRRRKYVN